MRLPAHFGQWLVVGCRGRNVRCWQVAPSLIYGQVKKSYRRRKLVRVSHVMRLLTEDADPRRLTSIRLLWPVEHSIYRADQSDCSSWDSCASSSHVGHLSTGSPAAGQSGMVALLLPFCAPSRIPSRGACAAARTRWQTSGATLSATDASHGSRQNHPTLDGARGALLPLPKVSA